MTADVSPDAPRPPVGIRDSGGPMPFNEADFTRDAARMVAEGDRVPAQRQDGCVMTMTLSGFLLARIDEDAQEARGTRLDIDRWRRENALNGADGSQGSITVASLIGTAMDPARVLAECEAKARLLEEYETSLTTALSSPRGSYDEGIVTGIMAALYALALPYADHPDYRHEWRP